MGRGCGPFPLHPLPSAPSLPPFPVLLLAAASPGGGGGRRGTDRSPLVRFIRNSRWPPTMAGKLIKNSVCCHLMQSVQWDGRATKSGGTSCCCRRHDMCIIYCIIRVYRHICVIMQQCMLYPFLSYCTPVLNGELLLLLSFNYYCYYCCFVVIKCYYCY